MIEGEAELLLTLSLAGLGRRRVVFCVWEACVRACEHRCVRVRLMSR